MPILHLHGIYDEWIPTCVPPEDIVSAGFEGGTGIYSVSPSTCDDNHQNSVCASADGFLYTPLKTTLETYARGVSYHLGVGWSGRAMTHPLFFLDDKRNARLRCAHVDDSQACNGGHPCVSVCLFNGGHLPFQDADCEWIDDDPATGPKHNSGALAFAALLAQWLEQHVNVGDIALRFIPYSRLTETNCTLCSAHRHTSRNPPHAPLAQLQTRLISKRTPRKFNTHTSQKFDTHDCGQ